MPTSLSYDLRSRVLAAVAGGLSCRQAAARSTALRSWISSYNHSRPHSALGGHPPISRIARNNVLGNDS